MPASSAVPVTPDIPKFLQGGGAMGERIRAFDWSRHPLGLPERWPESLRMAMSLCLNSSFPTAIYWGPELHILYNDAWSVIPAEKHPWMLGKPAQEGWSDIWPIIGPQFRRVMEGEGLALYEEMLPMVRGGQPRETWWNYSITPIRNADHSVAGIFNQGNEVTEIVLGRRRREAELARWRETFHQAPVPVALLRGPEHVFEFANDAYLRLVGGRAVAGKALRDALPEIVEQGFVELLDGVHRSGEPYIGAGAKVMLQRAEEGPVEERVLDFIYQPLRDAAGQVDGVLVLATDVTERARAESALRLTNWQLGEERARLASLMEAEQRARLALRRVSDGLEATVKARTAELTQALQAQRAATERLRAAFATDLIFQGFMETDGTLRDANPASLAAIGSRLQDVVGRPFWETPWFAATDGAPERIRAAVDEARQGRSVQGTMAVRLPQGERQFRFLIRPMVNARGELVGLIPEAQPL
ncbi:PAS domain-containing protein [Ramlibacter ginsenosidimutans]|uniref:PAS domain-containing protein n=1 Tax=Ramlibacter ginsenosidimutans TaxID=502333 RepID=A0A934TVN5_9BURK|nr:PAS domain-containing protein [Ramlibacter ginsenosidimutans]MBK6007861.1 PAS domain-containing protein [Ramlibacter ginsenosidimutans]